MNLHYNSPEEEELITSCQNGDKEAFSRLIIKYERFVYTTVKVKGCTGEDALDVSQEIFIKIWKNISRYRGDCRFSTWVYKISVNAALDFLRRLKNSPSEIIFTKTDDEGDEISWEVADEGSISPESYVEKSERIKIVRESIEMLSTEQREVIILRDIEGYSYDEISEMLGIGVGTVKSRLNRARVNLREILIKLGWDKPF